MGAETQDCAPLGMGEAVELRAWLCSLSKRDRSSHGDTAGSVVAVSASAGPAIHLYQSGDRAAPCGCSIIASCGRAARLEILMFVGIVERNRVLPWERRIREGSSGTHSSVNAESSRQTSAATQALPGRMRLSLCVYVWNRQPA